MKKKTIGEKAYEYLQNKGIDGVMWGDTHLLHEIAEYCGLGHEGYKTEKQILNAVDRTPDLFIKGYSVCGRIVRSFILKRG